MIVPSAQLIAGWIVDDLERGRFDALRTACATLGEGWVLEAGGDPAFERAFSPRLGVLVAKHDATLDEEEVGMGMAIELSAAGDASVLPGTAFPLSAVASAMKTAKASLPEAQALVAKHQVKLFDPERPSLSLLAVGSGLRAALVGGADGATLVSQVHANDGARVVKKPTGKSARLCAWFAS